MFAAKWNVTQQWSNTWKSLSPTMLPRHKKRFCQDTKRDFADPYALFDIFAVYRCSSVLAKPQAHNSHQVFIPTGCTGEIQP